MDDEISRQRTEILRLVAELNAAREQIELLTETVSDQAKTLAAVTDDCPPHAPSLAIIYWLYCDTRRGEKGWPKITQLIRPIISDIGETLAPKMNGLVWGVHRARRASVPSERTGRPICDAVLNNSLSRLKEMLAWAVDNKLLKYNAMSGVRAIPTVSRRETWLPPDDLDRLIAAAPLVVDRRLPDGQDNGLRGKILAAFVLCCHDSMLRFTEAQTLLRDRIGADGRVELGSKQTKGKKRRVVFLTPRTMKAIARLSFEQSNPFVFQDIGEVHALSKRRDRHQPIHERRLHYWFRNLCEISGVDAMVAPGENRVRPHDLRASGASTADENGARPTAIRDALGHARLATTEIYLRSERSENARSVAAVIEAATTKRVGPKRSPNKKSKPDSHFPVARQARR